jgi:hypothetical protein
MPDSFEIIFRPHAAEGKYRMKVDVLYKSAQVIRFRVHAGEKYINMEKRLLNKSNHWKVTETNIDMVGSGIAKSTYTVFEIQERLEEYIKKDDGREKGNVKYEH